MTVLGLIRTVRFYRRGGVVCVDVMNSAGNHPAKEARGATPDEAWAKALPYLKWLEEIERAA